MRAKRAKIFEFSRQKSIYIFCPFWRENSNTYEKNSDSNRKNITLKTWKEDIFKVFQTLCFSPKFRANFW